MTFEKITKVFYKTEEITDTLMYRMAERILCDALAWGASSVTIRCCPREKDAFADAAAQDAPEAHHCIDGRGGYELGFFIGDVGETVPYLTVPVNWFLPLLNILSSERIEHNGKQCFAVCKDAGSSKEAIRYLDLALYCLHENHRLWRWFPEEVNTNTACFYARPFRAASSHPLCGWQLT